MIVETKVLKQLVRDLIQPDRNLGHSDRKGHKAKTEPAVGIAFNGKTDAENVEAKVVPNVENTSQFNAVVGKGCEDCQ